MGVANSFEYDPSEHAAALAAVTRQTAARWIAPGLGLGVPLLMTALTLADDRYRADPSAAFWGVLPYWVLFGFLGFGLLPLQRRWAARSLPKSDPTVRGLQRRRLDDSGLLVEAPGVQLELKWAAIQRVIETPELFLFFFSKQGGYYYPKRVLTAGEVDEVRSMIRAHIGGRAILLG